MARARAWATGGGRVPLAYFCSRCGALRLDNSHRDCRRSPSSHPSCSRHRRVRHGRAPLMSRAGLSPALARRVLRAALDADRRLTDAGLVVPVAVNLLAVDF